MLVPLGLALALALGSTLRNLETSVHDFFEQFVHLTMNALALFNGERTVTLGAILEKLEKATHSTWEKKRT